MKRWAIKLSMGVSIVMVFLGAVVIFSSRYPCIWADISWDKAILGLGIAIAGIGLGNLASTAQIMRATVREQELDDRIANRVIDRDMN